MSAILWGTLFFFLPLGAGLFLKERHRTAEQVKADTHHGFIDNVMDLLRTFKSRNFVCLTYVFLPLTTLLSRTLLYPCSSFLLTSLFLN